MAEVNVILTTKVKWWVWLYVDTIRLFCLTFKTKPDLNKIKKIVAKGVSCDAHIEPCNNN